MRQSAHSGDAMDYDHPIVKKLLWHVDHTADGWAIKDALDISLAFKAKKEFMDCIAHNHNLAVMAAFGEAVAAAKKGDL